MSGFPKGIIPAADSIAAFEKSAHTLSTADFASKMYERILATIKDFEDSIDSDSEVALKLASFGQSITLGITDVGFRNPYLITFHGFVDGNEATLAQHVSQVNFLMVAIPKADPAKPARRIGFQSRETEQDED